MQRFHAHSMHRSGFTLMETIATVVVLAIGLPPVLYAVREAHVQRVNPARASTARWLGAERLEEIIADRHGTTRGYSYLQPANYPFEAAIAGFESFSRRVTLAETEADLLTPGAGCMTVEVEVGWTDATGAAKTCVVTTVLTEYDS